MAGHLLRRHQMTTEELRNQSMPYLFISPAEHEKKLRNRFSFRCIFKNIPIKDYHKIFSQFSPFNYFSMGQLPQHNR